MCLTFLSAVIAVSPSVTVIADFSPVELYPRPVYASYYEPYDDGPYYDDPYYAEPYYAPAVYEMVPYYRPVHRTNFAEAALLVLGVGILADVFDADVYLSFGSYYPYRPWAYYRPWYAYDPWPYRAYYAPTYWRTYPDYCSNDPWYPRPVRFADPYVDRFCYAGPSYVPAYYAAPSAPTFRSPRFEPAVSRSAPLLASTFERSPISRSQSFSRPTGQSSLGDVVKQDRVRPERLFRRQADSKAFRNSKPSRQMIARNEHVKSDRVRSNSHRSSLLAQQSRDRGAMRQSTQSLDRGSDRKAMRFTERNAFQSRGRDRQIDSSPRTHVWGGQDRGRQEFRQPRFESQNWGGGRGRSQQVFRQPVQEWGGRRDGARSQFQQFRQTPQNLGGGRQIQQPRQEMRGSGGSRGGGGGQPRGGSGQGHGGGRGHHG